MDLKNYRNYSLYQGKSILSIDYGTKVVGLATFRPENDPYPLPYERIIFKTEKQVISDIISIINSEFIDLLIMGLPLFTDGKETKMSQITRAFATRLLKQLPNITMFFQNEALSTREAEDRMKNSPRYNFKVDLKQIDSLSAAIILEDFIKT